MCCCCTVSMNVCSYDMEKTDNYSFFCYSHSPHSLGRCDLGSFKVCPAVTRVLLPGGRGFAAGMTSMTKCIGAVGVPCRGGAFKVTKLSFTVLYFGLTFPLK